MEAIAVRDLKVAREAGESIAAIAAVLQDGDERESGLYRVVLGFARRIGGTTGERFAAWVHGTLFSYDGWENARHAELQSLAQTLNRTLATKSPLVAATTGGTRKGNAMTSTNDSARKAA